MSMWKFTVSFFKRDTAELPVLLSRSRARARLGAGILAGDTDVESGSQKARPLTLAATTRRVFLPAAMPPFLPSFVSRASPFSVARESYR